MDPIVGFAWIVGLAVGGLLVAAEICAQLGFELRESIRAHWAELFVAPADRQLCRSVRATAAGLDELAERETVDRLQRRLLSERLPAIVDAQDRLRGPVLTLDLGETLVELRLHSLDELSQLAAKHHPEMGSLVELSYVDEIGWCIRVDLDGGQRRCSGWRLIVGRPGASC